MNEKCKYCNYVPKCSQYCEYNSLICMLNRSFPKVVDKSYEELQQENQELKNQQKEFMEWLENIVGNLEKQQSLRFNHSYQYKIDTLKSCLLKYKEICKKLAEISDTTAGQDKFKKNLEQLEAKDE